MQSGGGGSSAAEPSRYPLELVSPRQSGTAPSNDVGTENIPAAHPIFFNYPGEEYEWPIVVIGGAPPFEVSVTGDAALAWRTDPNGRQYPVVYLANPSASFTYAISVTDAEDTTVTSGTVSVTRGTTGWRFFDSAAGNDSWNGTSPTFVSGTTGPWATPQMLYSGSTAGLRCIWNGTFNFNGMTPDPGNSTGQFTPPGNTKLFAFNGSSQSVQWMIKTGGTFVWDMGNVPGVTQAPFINMQGTTTYPIVTKGMRLTNLYHCGFRIGTQNNHYMTHFKLEVDTIDQLVDGANSSAMMYSASGAGNQQYTAIIAGNFHDNAAGGQKSYTQHKSLVANCRFDGAIDGPDIKGDHERWEYREVFILNTTEDNHGGLFGNMQTANGGEARFCYIDRTGVTNGEALSVNEGDTGGAGAGETHVYRNTLVGFVVVRGLPNDQGPYYFDNNVIVNSDSGYTDRIALSGTPGTNVMNYGEESGTNLVGAVADNIVDVNGDLQGSYLTSNGPATATPKGHMASPWVIP